MRNGVVPRKGDVDRNWPVRRQAHGLHVVPRKGDVDRNLLVIWFRLHQYASSPARGTWIEILFFRRLKMKKIPSSPARGTWIEI